MRLYIEKHISTHGSIAKEEEEEEEEDCEQQIMWQDLEQQQLQQQQLQQQHSHCVSFHFNSQLIIFNQHTVKIIYKQ